MEDRTFIQTKKHIIKAFSKDDDNSSSKVIQLPYEMQNNNELSSMREISIDEGVKYLIQTLKSHKESDKWLDLPANAFMLWLSTFQGR